VLGKDNNTDNRALKRVDSAHDTTPPPSTDVPKDIAGDIKERIVEFNKRELPPPPLLQPAPAGKPLSMRKRNVKKESNTEPTPLQDHVTTPRRAFLGRKSLAPYTTFLWQKKTKEGIDN
jgi:hypothetical protein